MDHSPRNSTKCTIPERSSNILSTCIAAPRPVRFHKDGGRSTEYQTFPMGKIVNVKALQLSGAICRNSVLHPPRACSHDTPNAHSPPLDSSAESFLQARQNSRTKDMTPRGRASTQSCHEWPLGHSNPYPRIGGLEMASPVQQHLRAGQRSHITSFRARRRVVEKSLKIPGGA